MGEVLLGTVVTDALDLTPVIVSSCLMRVLRTSDAIPFVLMGVAVMQPVLSSSAVMK